MANRIEAGSPMPGDVDKDMLSEQIQTNPDAKIEEAEISAKTTAIPAKTTPEIGSVRKSETITAKEQKSFIDRTSGHDKTGQSNHGIIPPFYQKEQNPKVEGQNSEYLKEFVTQSELPNDAEIRGTIHFHAFEKKEQPGENETLLKGSNLRVVKVEVQGSTSNNPLELAFDPGESASIIVDRWEYQRAILHIIEDLRVMKIDSSQIPDLTLYIEGKVDDSSRTIELGPPTLQSELIAASKTRSYDVTGLTNQLLISANAWAELQKFSGQNNKTASNSEAVVA